MEGALIRLYERSTSAAILAIKRSGIGAHLSKVILAMPSMAFGDNSLGATCAAQGNAGIAKREEAMDRLAVTW